MPFTLIALITILLHKMSKHEAKVAIKDSFCQISGAAIALLSVLPWLIFIATQVMLT